MDPGIFLFLFVALFVAAILIGIFFNEDARIRRALAKRPLVPIRSATGTEPVRFVGQILAVGPPIQSPLGRQPCVYWEVAVKVHRRSGKHSHWRTVIDRCHGVDFLVRDGTGEVLVKMAATPSVALESTSRFDSGAFNDPPPHFEEFLAAHGESATTFFGFNRRIRYTEGTLRVGQTIAISGRLRWDTVRGPSGDEKRLVLDGTPDAPILASDRSGAES